MISQMINDYNYKQELYRCVVRATNRRSHVTHTIEAHVYFSFKQLLNCIYLNMFLDFRTLENTLNCDKYFTLISTQQIQAQGS